MEQTLGKYNSLKILPQSPSQIPHTSLLTTRELGPQERAALEALAANIQGEVRLDPLYRHLYAQDASIFREEPIGVVFPRTKEDLCEIVGTAQAYAIPLIPRGAGTSLAGQVVGFGLVVDVSRYLNKILEVDVERRLVRVEPGVVREDLNRELRKYGLQFAPETSTSNRCTLGGMIGNNSCGTNSIKYGTTRDHLHDVELLFVDGTLERLGEWDRETYDTSLTRNDILGEGLTTFDTLVRSNRDLIRERYPRPEVLRRNNGYPFDIALEHEPFSETGRPFSLARLFCGTEGTLAFLTEATLKLEPLPKAKAIMPVHFSSLEESLRATQLAVTHRPAAVEIIDKRTLDSAKLNIEQEKNRFFVEGDPEAVIVIGGEGESKEEVLSSLAKIEAHFREHNLGYAFPVLEPPLDKAVWELRKEGLGIVMGQPGDVKPETSIEDTAVPVEVMPEYIAEVLEILKKYDTSVMLYGHVSVGVVHMRPELNLKLPGDKEKHIKILEEVTELVKKYRGSISGEHGDGRLRSPYLPTLLGEELMKAHAALKAAFDPKGILNPGKIVAPKPVDEDWRAYTGRPTPEVPTVFNWDAKMGLVRAVEKCNGVGACRKSAGSGGTMCPSYMATLDEKDSTRGRANLFQYLFSENEDPRQAFVSEELYEALDLCLSCKGCKRECPASIDMARMKAEFMQAYYDEKGTPLSSLLFGYYTQLCKLGALTPRLANFSMTFGPLRALLGKILQVAPQRSLPLFAKQTFRTWFAQNRSKKAEESSERELVFLYVDPFTNFTEPQLGEAALTVLEAGGFRVELLPVEDDGRTLLSKGLLRAAKKLNDRNLSLAKPLFAAHPGAKIVGIEPSALLTFRDEMPDLVSSHLREDARRFASRAFLLEEFVVAHHQEFAQVWNGALKEKETRVLLHGHCHQKALVGTTATEAALGLAGYSVETLSTGCCGMAGSFGYEAKHYDLSMKVGELVLFPRLRESAEDQLIAAPGTSCRHQIADGVKKKASHPITLLAEAILET